MKTEAKFILSTSKVLEQYQKVKSLCNIVSYSYKTNPHVGNVLKDNTTCHFSVHSIESLKEINDADRIWFFGQAWTKLDIIHLTQLGVKKFIVDNPNDLDVLLHFLKEKKITITLLLRMRLKEHTIHTGKHFVFGMFSKTINEVLPSLSKNPHIDQLGIHFHRKTQNISEWSLIEELQDSIQKENWKHISLVNIGGGLPSIYKNFRPEIFKGIFEHILELKNWLLEKNIQMIIEPGRFIAAPSVILESKIINIYDNTIVIDSSIFNAAIDTWIAHIRLLVKNEKEKGTPYVIKGCTPDSADILRYKVYLDTPQIGDTLTFLNAGAYNFLADFCHLPKIPTKIIK